MNPTLTAAPGEPGPRRFLSQGDEFLRRDRLADQSLLSRAGVTAKLAANARYASVFFAAPVVADTTPMDEEPIPFTLTKAAEKLFAMSAADDAAHTAASHVSTSGLTRRGRAALARLEATLGLGGASNAA
ncbi:MAG: hypothetical protein JO362_21805 [Streptomycetaceae bacterium]|nr:hypothetical protein [Streptomycetaceae bacterium]